MAISIPIVYVIPLQFQCSYLCYYSKNECKNSTDNAENVRQNKVINVWHLVPDKMYPLFDYLMHLAVVVLSIIHVPVVLKNHK